MTETLFTPGEWRVEQGTTLVWGACNADDPTSRGMGYPVADVRTTAPGTWAKGHPNEAEGIANAHLIAASPDLYAACRYALGYLTDEDDPMIDEDGDEVCPFERMRAALLKARGEPSND